MESEVPEWELGEFARWLRSQRDDRIYCLTSYAQECPIATWVRMRPQVEQAMVGSLLCTIYMVGGDRVEIKLPPWAIAYVGTFSTATPRQHEALRALTVVEESHGR